MLFRIAPILLLLFVACSGDPEVVAQNQNLDPVHQKMRRDGKKPEQSTGALLTSNIKLVYIITPFFKFYDYARVNTYKSGLIKVELFKYGQVIGSIRIKDNKMCVLSECSFSWAIGKKFFGAVSYGDLFQHILFRKSIFDGKGTQVGPDNIVIQRFQQSGQMIYYERNDSHSLYKNLSTGVTVLIDDYPLNSGGKSIVIPK